MVEVRTPHLPVRSFKHKKSLGSDEPRRFLNLVETREGRVFTICKDIGVGLRWRMVNNYGMAWTGSPTRLRLDHTPRANMTTEVEKIPS